MRQTGKMQNELRHPNPRRQRMQIQADPVMVGSDPHGTHEVRLAERATGKAGKAIDSFQARLGLVTRAQTSGSGKVTPGSPVDIVTRGRLRLRLSKMVQ